MVSLEITNEICFQGRKWTGMKGVILKIARMLRRWVPMLQQEMKERVEELINQLEAKASSPPQITWHNLGDSSSRSAPLVAQHSVSSIVTLARHDQDLSVGSDVLNVSEMLP